MKLYVKEKLITLHNRFYIFNENEEKVFEIEREFLSLIRKTIRIFDMNHTEVARIEKEIFHITPHYNVYVNNEFKLSIAKKFNLIRNDYELSNNYKIDGSFLNLDFTVKNSSGIDVAYISRKLISIGDKYQIDILDDNDLLTILSIIVAITNDVDDMQRRSNNHINNLGD